MTDSEKEAFCELVGAMAVVYGRPADSALFAGWWLSMRDWSLAEFSQAASQVMKTTKFMPVPADFANLRRAAQITGSEAWKIALKRCLNWRNARDTTDLIDRAVNGVGGYRAIAMADVESALPHLERRFKAAYDEIGEAEEVRKALPNLCPDEPSIRIESEGLKRLK